MFKAAVDETACEKYLYDVRSYMHDPNDPNKFQAIEKTLRPVEKLGQQAINQVLVDTADYRAGSRKASNSPVISDSNREILAVFAAMQYFSTPDKRESIRASLEPMSKVFLNAKLSKMGISGEDYDLEISEDHVTS